MPKHHKREIRKKIAGLFLLGGNFFMGFTQTQVSPTKREEDANIGEVSQSAISKAFNIRSVIMAGATATARVLFAVSDFTKESGPSGPQGTIDR